MRMEVIALGISMLACGLFLPNVVRAQAALMPLAVQNTATCINDPGKLASFELIEKDPAVIASAEGLANTIVQVYKDQGKPADLSGRWLSFNLLILRTAMAKCLQQTQAQEKKDKTQAAKTQAVTGETNTQLGATSASNGSTSAVQKVGIPQLLGIAVENGAVNNSINGTTMTLGTTPYGFVYAFARNEDTQTRYENLRFFTQLGVSAAFNVASSSDPLQSATRKAVSQWQAKYTFRDTSARSRDAWNEYEVILSRWAGEAMAVESNHSLAGAADSLTDPANILYRAAWNSANSKLKAAASAPAPTANDLTAKIKNVGSEVLRLLEDDEYQQALSKAEKSFADSPSLFDLLQKLATASARYDSQVQVFDKAVKDLTKGWNGSLAFGQNFPTSTTTTSSSSTASPAPAYLQGEFDITYAPKAVITEKAGVGGDPATHTAVDPSKWTPSVTGNFIGTFYTNPRSSLNEKTFRGGKFAAMAQWDLPQGPFASLMSLNDKSKMTLALSSSYERLQENRGKKGKKADIVLGNVKLTIPLPGGVSFPFAVSFANATSQVKGSYVEGNFGFTFNLDALASLIKVNQ